MMNQTGQIYFASDEDIPEEDKVRLERAERLAHAKVGLDALIDEATGYQEQRSPDDLRKRLVQYMDGQ